MRCSPKGRLALRRDQETFAGEVSGERLRTYPLHAVSPSQAVTIHRVMEVLTAR